MKKSLFIISTLFLVLMTGYFVFSTNNQYTDESISVNGTVYNDYASTQVTDGPSLNNNINTNTALSDFFTSYKGYFTSSKSTLNYVGYAEYGYTLNNSEVDNDNLTIKYSGEITDGYGEDSRGARTFSLNYIFKLDEKETPMVYERIYNNDYMSSNKDSLNSIIKNYIVMWGEPKENDTWTQSVTYNGKQYTAKTVMKNVSYTKYDLETTINDIDGFHNKTYIEKRTYDRGYGLISFENTPSIKNDGESFDLIFGYKLNDY